MGTSSDGTYLCSSWIVDCGSWIVGLWNYPYRQGSFGRRHIVITSGTRPSHPTLTNDSIFQVGAMHRACRVAESLETFHFANGVANEKEGTSTLVPG